MHEMYSKMGSIRNIQASWKYWYSDLQVQTRFTYPMLDVPSAPTSKSLLGSGVANPS